MGRPLYHLGNSVFYPAGAHAVRISFISAGKEMTMTVDDPDLVLTAKRK